MIPTTSSTRFLLNDQEVCTDAPPGLLVLDWLRKHRHLTGTKEGCKEGDCGACVVLIGRLSASGGLAYRPVTSCLTPLGELAGKHLVTIEGLNLPHGELTPLQRAVVEEGGTQCGYCTPGIIVSMTHCLMESPGTADPASMKDALSGHLCRCTGYGSLKRAALRVCASCTPAGAFEETVPELVGRHILPAYFVEIPDRLRAIASPPLSPPKAGAPRIAGGTDIYVQRGEEISDAPVHLLNLYPDMDGVRMSDGRLLVGALTTFEAFGRIPEIRARIPRIREFLHLMASLQIRHRATLGGNVVNASPIGDMTILLLALDAEACLRGPGSERTLPLHELYRGYKQLALKDDEIVSSFTIPLDPGEVRIHFEKVSKRRCLDIASVNSAAKITLEGDVIRSAALSLGGVAPIPMRLAGAEAWVTGKTLTTRLVQHLQDRVGEEIAPIDDIRGSADYKRLLARQLVAAHFIELFPDQVDVKAFV